MVLHFIGLFLSNGTAVSCIASAVLQSRRFPEFVAARTTLHVEQLEPFCVRGPGPARPEETLVKQIARISFCTGEFDANGLQEGIGVLEHLASFAGSPRAR